jgi:hypothetical protein
MAQYWADFDADLTAFNRGLYASNADWQVTDQILRDDLGRVEGLSLIAAEDDAGRDEVEIAGEWSSTTAAQATRSIAHLRSNGATLASSSSYYALMRRSATLRLIRVLSGASTTLADASTFSYAANTWYRYRFRANGTSLRAKFWLASDEEPSTWLVDTTDSDLSTSVATGPIGTGTAQRWRGVGVGTAGDSAPLGPVSGPAVPTNLIVAETTATSVRWTWT